MPMDWTCDVHAWQWWARQRIRTNERTASFRLYHTPGTHLHLVGGHPAISIPVVPPPPGFIYSTISGFFLSSVLSRSEENAVVLDSISTYPHCVRALDSPAPEGAAFLFYLTLPRTIHMIQYSIIAPSFFLFFFSYCFTIDVVYCMYRKYDS